MIQTRVVFVILVLLMGLFAGCGDKKDSSEEPAKKAVVENLNIQPDHSTSEVEDSSEDDTEKGN